MKLHELTPAVFLISSAESAEALTLLAYSAEAVASTAKAGRSSSYGPSPEGFGPQGGRSVRRIHPRAHARGLLRRRIKSGKLRSFSEMMRWPSGQRILKAGSFHRKP